MNSDHYEVLLAALLHDIGKFKQRAFGGREPSDFPVEMEGIILPKAQGQWYSHRHALWTFNFFEREFAAVDLPRGLDRNRVRDLASKHHNSSNEYERFIERADRFSAAGDRLKDDTAHYERGEYLKKPLAPVFPRITLSDSPHAAGVYAYPLLPLDSQSIFPIEGKGGGGSLEKEYRSLWSDFVEGLGALPGAGSTPEQFTQALVSLLERYTWCVPSATNDRYGDISLFDHALTTAAIALVLKLHAEGGGRESDERPFLFLGADLSGIQQFIFQNQREPFRGSAKVIRGRSFYVAVTAQAYLLALCDALQIPPFTQLMNAGGKFTVLLPNLPAVREKAESFCAHADAWFFKRFHGTFTVVHDLSITAGENEMNQKGFRDLVSRINFNLAQAKSSKFSSILERGECVIPVAYSEGDLCKACGRFPKNADGDDARCDYCDELFRLGERLTRNTVLGFHRSGGDVLFFDGAVGITVGPVDRADGAYLRYSLVDDHGGMPVFHLNAHVPRNVDGDTMTFEEIAEQAVHAERIKGRDVRVGVDLLSYIKIDVDNLGNIFGFGMDELSVSRYVSLSRMLHLFFNLAVKNLLAERFGNFYTVLSGGDDLFLIAPWDRSLDFLDELEQAFHRFVCGNPDVHFSAGVVLQHPRFPMSKAADLADGAIEEAKNAGRNRVQFLTGMNYDEMRTLAVKAGWLKAKAAEENSKIGHAFLYRLLAYLRMAERVRGASLSGGRDSASSPDLMYIPRFRYDVARNIAVKSAGALVNGDEVLALVDLFDRYSRENPGLLRAACTVALYEIREQSPHKEVSDD